MAKFVKLTCVLNRDGASGQRERTPPPSEQPPIAVGPSASPWTVDATDAEDSKRNMIFYAGS